MTKVVPLITIGFVAIAAIIDEARPQDSVSKYMFSKDKRKSCENTRE